MRSSSIGLVVAILLPASLAAAQPGPAATAGPPSGPPPAQAGEPSVEAGVGEDAASGRTWMSPTALTPPAGTFSAQSVQILIAGASYSPTDRLAISANAFIPLPGAPWIVLAGVKLKLADLGRLKVGAHLGLGYLEGELLEEDGDGGEADVVREVWGARAYFGGVATLCLDRGCHSLLNGYLSFPVAMDDEGEVYVGLAGYGSVAWLQRVTRRLKLALEIFAYAGGGEVDVAGWYGVRFAWPSFAIDAGLIRIICDACEGNDDHPAVGLPWLAFTYRAL